MVSFLDRCVEYKIKMQLSLDMCHVHITSHILEHLTQTNFLTNESSGGVFQRL